MGNWRKAMRKITIEIELDNDDEATYKNICAELVVEDFLKPLIGFRVVSDSYPPE